MPGVTEPQDTPDEGVADIVTVPEKPFSDKIVTVDVEVAPGATATGVEALIEKSRKLKIAVAV